MTDRIYYVYELRIQGDEFPFYIGKGKNERLFEHFDNYEINTNPLGNKHKVHKIRKALNDGLEVTATPLEENLTECEAHEREKFYIALYGRRDKGTGCLTNMTDGGEGMSGFVPSEEQRKRQSELLLTPEYREFFRNQTRELWKNDTYRKNVIEGINRSWTPERRAALSERNKKFAAQGCYDESIRKLNAHRATEEGYATWHKNMVAAISTPEHKAKMSRVNKEKMSTKEAKLKVFKPFYISTRCYYKTEGWRLEYKKALQVCCLEIQCLRKQGYGQMKISKLVFGDDSHNKLYTALMDAMRIPMGGSDTPFDPMNDEGYLEWRSGQDVESARRIIFRDKYDEIMKIVNNVLLR